MTESEKRRANVIRWTAKTALVIYDALAVTFSYYIALLIRFYVNHEVHAAAQRFFPAFYRIAPFYAVICILVFMYYKLYSGIWRFAGLGDMNRIIKANIVTCIIHVAGSILLVQRMPLTYYVLGALIQFVLIALSRFSYRFLVVEFSKLDKNDDATKIMIVGNGESARSLIRQYESNRESMIRPVCVMDYRNASKGMLFDGLPVVGNIDELDSIIDVYDISGVIISDSLMPAETRELIKNRCKESGLEVQDYSWYAQNVRYGISFRHLMEYTGGKVEVVLNGKTKLYDDPEQAVKDLPERYNVKSIHAGEDCIVVTIDSDNASANAVSEEWIHEYEEETGESVSFF